MRAHPTPRHGRGGVTRRKLLLALSLASASLALAWGLWPERQWGAASADPLTLGVERGRFVHEIVERGTVESASNVEVRCEVQAKGSFGTQIIEVIPEGTYVQPGDVLVRLDSSALEAELTKQQIACINSEATMVKTKNDFEAAKIAKEEYEKGTYQQSAQAIQSEISTAQENLRRARDYVKYSERLFARGYVTQLQLEADRFAVEKAQTDEEVATTKLRVLRDYTQAKTLKTLTTAIATAEAAMKAAAENHHLDAEQLAHIQRQVERCVVKAPEAGQVVYANNASHGGGGKAVIIQEGELVRERQVLIRLPDPKRMQVMAKVNEARVSLVAVGQAATIRLDAFSGLALEGEIEKVNEYPSPPPWFNPNVKEYEATVKLPTSPPGMRPGLTAEVRILIQEIADAIHVPVQSVIEHGGRHYCMVRDGNGWKGREVEIGPTNDKTVVIRDGLQTGEDIVLNAAALRTEADLPEIKGGGGDRSLPGANIVRKPSGAATPAALAEQMFADYDKDRDGRIEIDQVPPLYRAALVAADADRNGKIDRAEFNSVARKMLQPGGPRTARKDP